MRTTPPKEQKICISAPKHGQSAAAAHESRTPTIVINSRRARHTSGRPVLQRVQPSMRRHVAVASARRAARHPSAKVTTEFKSKFKNINKNNCVLLNSFYVIFDFRCRMQSAARIAAPDHACLTRPCRHDPRGRQSAAVRHCIRGAVLAGLWVRHICLPCPNSHSHRQRRQAMDARSVTSLEYTFNCDFYSIN